VKLLLTGASTDRVCGTRDYATTLAEPLRRIGADVRFLWWDRATRTLDSWTADLRDAVADADVTLWQYSCFTYTKRGLPTLVPRVLRALTQDGVPLVTVFHELVFPWGVNGVRGAVHAATHRFALHPIVRASAGLVVTTEERREWVESRRWLPHRPTTFLPVVSNIAGTTPAERNDDELRVGVFGFRRLQLPVQLIVDSVARVPRAHLVLVGAPGPNTPEAETWRKAAAAAGAPELVSFTGVLDPEPLASELAAVDLVLFPDPIGPTTRRGTLAAALAHGKPVVALDGPQTWDRFLREHALTVVPPEIDALAEAMRRLAADPRARAEQGRRARAFHDRYAAPDVVADGLLSFASRAAR